MVVDSRHVQNGSFNYTAGAAKANSENVLVIWNDTDLAASFLKHWQSRWNQGSGFTSTD
ncbi:phospholipase D-like domain-containing protein [Herbaspirillum autotrophicum]|uniref:phospholipase D-like domain-containing protein n=1 Tax=Herbaspirillum autotrophicum TaxID=180195 RepID=UPI0022B60979|nr:phospholipase D-like domain-containing protein [Herbaspirillum autotrophicum]